MHCVRKVTDDLYWVGANEKRLNLFENIHPVPQGTSYNSYLLLDEKNVLFDSVDWSVCRQLLDNVEYVLGGKKLDYIIVNHMEPDHGASLDEIRMRYPDAQVVCTAKAKAMMGQFGFSTENVLTVKEGDTLSFGKHEVTFFMAAMVHWPEVMFTYDKTNGALFTADAFGSFGTLDGRLFADEVNFDRDVLAEARRYYTNIVGKYGPQVQKVLGKLADIDLKFICPLHGFVWRKDFDYIIGKYDKWSKYEPEEKGVLICYASMYGNTENAANILAAMLCERGMTNIALYDVSCTDASYLIGEAFRFSHMALLSVTYNLKVFPVMQAFAEDMAALGLRNRSVGIVENGTWAPMAGTLLAEQIGNMKDMTILNEKMTVQSSVKDNTYLELEALADQLIASMND